MKITNYAATTPFDAASHGIEATEALRGPISNLFERAVAAIKAVRARRRRAAQLMSLDDSILRDIGIVEPEIGDLRARRQLLPPNWAD
jgi:uncharacterized protein YjiS (DUF1127 family)